MDLTNRNKNNLEILIVDDDVIMTLLHKNHLLRSNISYSTITCFNGKQALEYIEREKTKDKSFLVLLDLNMPVMNGWEFLEKCKGEDENKIFVVVITSSTYKNDLTPVLQNEKVLDYCLKPLNLEDVEKIKRLEKVKEFFN